MGREDLNYRRGRGGRPYQRAKKRVYETETHCAKCGQWVDKSLPYRDPYTGRVNKMSKSFGHSTELDAGAEPYDGHLEHLSCNSAAGGRYLAAKQRAQTTIVETELECSPDWEE